MTTEPVFGRTVLSMSGAEHHASRTVVSSPLRRNRVQDYLQPVIEPVITELIDQFAARGSADLVVDFTHRYSLLIISRLLGLPVDDEATIHRWAQAMIRYPFDPPAAVRCAAEFTAYVAPLVIARRREPGDDMISMLVTETTEGRESLSDAEIFTFLRMLFPLGAGHHHTGTGQYLVGLAQSSRSIGSAAVRPGPLPAVRGVGGPALGAGGRDAAARLPRGRDVARDRHPRSDPNDLRHPTPPTGIRRCTRALMTSTSLAT